MARQILPRNNFYDGQNVDETDLDVDQAAWHGSLANNTDFLAGSGVEQEFAIQRLLFDSDDVPASIQTLIDTQNFDGEPIYPIDSSSTEFSSASKNNRIWFPNFLFPSGLLR